MTAVEKWVSGYKVTYFPFSLTDQTAKNLVNRWLGQAAEEQKKNTKLQKIDLRHFCNGLDEPLKAEFSFPKQYSLFVPNYITN